MMKAERRFARCIQFIPVAARRLQQGIGADDIGLNKIRRP
jgi:hypothetical protein